MENKSKHSRFNFSRFNGVKLRYLIALIIVFFFFIAPLRGQSLLLTLGESATVTPYINDVLTCTSSGTAYISSTVAYGTWEWDFYKGADANTCDMVFISDGTSYNYSNDYNTRFKSTEQVYLLKDGTTLMVTASAFVNNEQWYHIKITRSESNVFTYYLDGVLLDVSGGSGTNPVTDSQYTESTYFLLDVDTGDKIRNLQINSTDYTNLNDFVGTGTGTYTVTDN